MKIDRNEEYFEEYHPDYRAEFDPRNYTLHKKIKEKYDYTCQKCGVDRDFIPSIPIDVHHIDGMPWNNNEDNLRARARVLWHALKAGFFEYPRKINTIELSKRLGMVPSTLSEITRRGFRRLLESHFKGDD